MAYHSNGSLEISMWNLFAKEMKVLEIANARPSSGILFYSKRIKGEENWKEKELFFQSEMINKCV